MNGLDEPHVAVGNEIAKALTSTSVFLGDGNDKAKVRRNQLVQSFRFTLPHSPDEFKLSLATYRFAVLDVLPVGVQ